MTGIQLIAAERERQIKVEKFSTEHDDEHAKGEILSAGIAYAAAAQQQSFPGRTGDMKLIRDLYWPWQKKWWKPGNRRANLIKAGALIAAELDRDIRKYG